MKVNEVKFRAFDNDSNEMIYQDKHTCFHIADGFVGIDCDETKDYDYREWSWKGSVGQTLMQFTDRQDYYDKDIYTLDIIALRSDEIVVVAWDGCAYNVYYTKKHGIDNIPLANQTNRSEIIGNIFTTPEKIDKELLKYILDGLKSGELR